jgi:cytosine/adenosine deaminase-related metal-dependent hydrolase
MELLIQNGTILTAHNKKVIRHGAIAVEDKTIIDAGKTHKLKRKYGRG